MKIYGITNCGSVKKALDFIKSSGVEYEFVDFKKQKPTEEQVATWAVMVGMDRLFNTKGTKYKSTGLNYKMLSDFERIAWLAKEPTMIKRPVVEYGGKVMVGFDEKIYAQEIVV